MKEFFWKLASKTVGVSMLAFVAASPALAVETVPITFVSGYPPQTTWVAAFNDYAAAVDKKLAETGAYKIEWNFAHSGQIAKARGELEAVQNGLADIGAIVTPFHLDREPIYQLPFVTPFSISDAGTLTQLYVKLEEKFPQFIGWEKGGVKLLSRTAVVDDYIIVSKKPIAGLADLNGMKVGGAAPVLPWITPVGAVGVASTQDQFFTMLDTGIVEGIVVTPAGAGAGKLCEPAKNILSIRVGAMSSVHLGVNMSTFWAGLPDEVKTAMTEAGPVYDEAQRRILEANDAKALQDCAAVGAKTVVLSDDVRREWAGAMPNLAQEWAKRVDGQGILGREVLTFYMDEVRAGGAKPARDWDKK